MCWQGAWLPAQITGLVFSSLVWLVVAGLSLTAAAHRPSCVGVVWLLGRNTRAGLWWRFGARPATPFERDLVLAAIVPISSLRGRHQPTIWIGRRISGADVSMPTEKDLVVSPALVQRIATGQLARPAGLSAGLSRAGPATGHQFGTWWRRSTPTARRGAS